MRIKLFYNKSVNDNAAYYYELAKEARAKLAGAEEAIKETEKEMEKASVVTKKEVRVKKQKEWFEKFHFSYSGTHLMIGGRNSKQNDIVVSKYFESNDLFFHADIQGGAAVILKDGKDATEEEQHEAAQFTASYSKAWINAMQQLMFMLFPRIRFQNMQLVVLSHLVLLPLKVSGSGFAEQSLP